MIVLGLTGSAAGLIPATVSAPNHTVSANSNMTFSPSTLTIAAGVPPSRSRSQSSQVLMSAPGAP